MNVLMRSNAHFKLNIKHLSSSQNELASSKNVQNFLRIFDDMFKITDVLRLKFATSAKDSIKTFENMMLKSNAHVNAFI